MLPKNYIPLKPFPDFKWKWASLQPTESINDPVILLGVLFRMRKLEPSGLKYSSDEFGDELKQLSSDTSDSIKGVDLDRRVGERNLIRNSGQYWRALGLLARPDNSGKIQLTEFGRRVADRVISQTEFSAITIQTFKLPNPEIQELPECQEWRNSGLAIRPLWLLLSILKELDKRNQGYLTPEEVFRIIIPLSGAKTSLQDYANFIIWYRAKEITLIGWPDCTPGANDKRIAREFLLFLLNYGYVSREVHQSTRLEEYVYLKTLDPEITAILGEPINDESVLEAVNQIQDTDIASEIERKRVQNQQRNRPNQARFRKEVLAAHGRCVITNVEMPGVLEAAHIKPFRYGGEDSVANGFAMRTDIHWLFDAGHLRISEDGEISLTTKARLDYGATIPPRIVVPESTNRDFLRWRWENYDGL